MTQIEHRSSTSVSDRLTLGLAVLAGARLCTKALQECKDDGEQPTEQMVINTILILCQFQDAEVTKCEEYTGLLAVAEEFPGFKKLWEAI